MVHAANGLCALSRSLSKTGASVPGDSLITHSTSVVAIWLGSRASRCSLISRAFSIAITAWAAKGSEPVRFPCLMKCSHLSAEDGQNSQEVLGLCAEQPTSPSGHRLEIDEKARGTEPVPISVLIPFIQ